MIFSAHESKQGRAALSGFSLQLGRAHCQVLPAEHGLLPRIKSVNSEVFCKDLGGLGGFEPLLVSSRYTLPRSFLSVSQRAPLATVVGCSGGCEGWGKQVLDQPTWVSPVTTPGCESCGPSSTTFEKNVTFSSPLVNVTLLPYQ